MLLEWIYGWIPEQSALHDVVLSYFNPLVCPFLCLWSHSQNGWVTFMNLWQRKAVAGKGAGCRCLNLDLGLLMLQPQHSRDYQRKPCLVCFVWHRKPLHKHLSTPWRASPISRAWIPHLQILQVPRHQLGYQKLFWFQSWGRADCNTTGSSHDSTLILGKLSSQIIHCNSP